MNGDKDTNLNLSDLSSALPSARVTYVTEHYYLGLLNIFRVMELLGNLISGTHIQERDAGALKFLKDIKLCRTDNLKGFKLDFFFDVNPYFKNSLLTKTYQMIDDDDEPVLEKAIGDKIIPHAVSWFTGEAVPEDDYEDMEDDDDDEDGADVEDDKEEGEDYADDDEKEGKTRKKIH
ncbi:hypothetical protein BHM03_00034175 [Ensete ventricosum]|nr:hypothetical protein BHM03_00034175 [Ensete ventricosum]